MSLRGGWVGAWMHVVHEVACKFYRGDFDVVVKV